VYRSCTPICTEVVVPKWSAPCTEMVMYRMCTPHTRTHAVITSISNKSIRDLSSCSHNRGRSIDWVLCAVWVIDRSLTMLRTTCTVAGHTERQTDQVCAITWCWSWSRSYRVSQLWVANEYAGQYCEFIVKWWRPQNKVFKVLTCFNAGFYQSVCDVWNNKGQSN